MSLVEHTYRVFKSTWGIYIKIIAKYTSISNYNEQDGIIEVCDGLKLVFANKQIVGEDTIFDEDVIYLIEGLKKVSGQILSNSKYEKNTIIVIHSINIAPCDFQEEGLVVAMIEWASIAFGFEVPPIDVTFNKETNKYEFLY
ncbi:hypothetical protein YDYSG_07110 [Paenibacillus tyrfis]|uniref:hypothetical protein n=1 Tax=Paenibacillus tyrfis TaxID=1501230 RepID=UPI0024903734|nr:hypothetical protein [Paenibacillus tyrfis]GLI04681.1 hypothetical protein YDYSG_07110 [Paenibacillus tyrfis]